LTLIPLKEKERRDQEKERLKALSETVSSSSMNGETGADLGESEEVSPLDTRERMLDGLVMLYQVAIEPKRNMMTNITRFKALTHPLLAGDERGQQQQRRQRDRCGV